MSRYVTAPVTHRPFVSTPIDMPAEQIINAKQDVTHSSTPLSTVLKKSRGTDSPTDRKLTSLRMDRSGNADTSSGT